MVAKFVCIPDCVYENLHGEVSEQKMENGLSRLEILVTGIYCVQSLGQE